MRAVPHKDKESIRHEVLLCATVATLSFVVFQVLDLQDSISKVEEWTEDDAVEFVARVVGLAVERDGSSGGFCRIFAIDRNGKKGYTRVLHR